MSTITSLKFDLGSSWDGSGVAAARRDLDNLNEDLRRVSANNATVNVTVDVDDSRLTALTARLDAFGGSHYTAHADVDVDDSQLTALVARLDAFGGSHYTTHVDVDADDSALTALTARLDAFGGSHYTTHATVDADSSGLTALTAMLDSFAASRYVAHVDLNIDDVGLSAMVARLEAFAASRYVAQVDLNIDDHGLTALIARLDAFGGSHYTAHADVDVDRASASLRRLADDVDGLNGRLGTLGGSLGGAGGSITALGGSAASASGGMSAMTMAITALVVIAMSALPAIGGLMTPIVGLGAAFGAAALALGPVIRALTDFGSGQKQAASASAQTASTVVANAQAIAGAQRQISDAQQAAAHTAQQSGQQIVAAQRAVQDSYRGIADAQRAAASQAIQSANSIAAAEQALGNAERAEQNAQAALTQARIDAKAAMDNLNNSVADGALSLRAANLQVQQAALALQAVNANASSTALMRAQAQLAYDQAKQGVIDQQTRLGQLTDQQKASNAAGIDGSKQVVAATQAEGSARQAVGNAETALATARRNANDAAIRSSEAIDKAQEASSKAVAALAAAQTNAAYQQNQANERVRTAEQNLADMRERQAIQYQQQQGANGSAVNKFAEDMAKLSPAGRELVNMLKGLQGQFSMLAQNAFLPGFNHFVSSVLALLPMFKGAIVTFGTGFGDFFAKVGDWMNSPLFRGEFASILKQAAGFLAELGNAVLQFLPSMTSFMAASAPATKAFADGFSAIVGTGLPDFFKELKPGIEAASVFVRAFLQIISGLLPVLAQLATILAQALAPVFKQLGPIIVMIAGIIADQLSRAVKILAPFLGDLAKALGQILIALTPLLPAMGTILVTALQALVTVMTPLLPLIVILAQGIGAIVKAIQPALPLITLMVLGIWAMNAALAANPIVLIVAAIALLVAGIVYLATKTQFFQTVWTATWNAVKVAAFAVWDALKVAWNAFINAMTQVWTTVSNALKVAWSAVWNAIKLAATAVWTALQTAWAAFINALASTWRTVSAALSSAWSAVWNAIKSAAQAVWSALQAAWSAFMTALRNVYNSFSSALSSAWSSFWNAIKAAAQAVWNAMQAAWTAVTNAVRSIYNAFASGLSAAWNAFWNAIKTAAQAVWNAIQAAWSAFTAFIRNTYNAFASALQAAWNAFWNAIKAAAQAVWNALVAAANALWNSLKSVFSAGSNWLLTTFWNPVKNFFTVTIPAAFSSAVAAIGKAWTTLKQIVRAPIQAIVDVVYNKGIVGVWNLVAGAFGAPKLSTFTLPAFAVGGEVNGPGTGTSDSIVARLSHGEHVWTADEVKGAGGHKSVASLRSAAVGGHAVREMGTSNGRYASGGGTTPVSPGDVTVGGTPTGLGGDPTKTGQTIPGTGLVTSGLDKLKSLALGAIGAVANPLLDAVGKAGKAAVNAIIPGEGIPLEKGADGMIDHAITAIKNWITAHDIAPTSGGNTAGAQKWADAQVGKPYSLGGNFGTTFDCSQFMSGITQIILGKAPSPLFTTFAFDGSKQGPATFERDLKAPFMVGVTNAGVGHMAGTLNGKNYEATPPAVRSGPSARGYNDPMFPMQYGMKASALGGVIPAGQHLQIIDAALAAAGVPPPGTKAEWEAGLNTLITRESNWNSGAVNNTDSNATAGTPSKGLAQVIQPTFDTYHVAGHNNILDPVDNVAAAIRYIVATYGNITNVQQANASLPPKGYWRGTKSAASGWAKVGEQGPEMVNFGGGGQAVRSFEDCVADIVKAAKGGESGGGSVNDRIKALIEELKANGSGTGDINITIPVHGVGNSQEVVDRIEAELFTKLRAVLEQNGRRR